MWLRRLASVSLETVYKMLPASFFNKSLLGSLSMYTFAALLGLAKYALASTLSAPAAVVARRQEAA